MWPDLVVPSATWAENKLKQCKLIQPYVFIMSGSISEVPCGDATGWEQGPMSLLEGHQHFTCIRELSHLNLLSCSSVELGEVRGQHPPAHGLHSWKETHELALAHVGLSCHIGGIWHVMVIKWFSHHIILYCKYMLQALLALGFGNHLSFCLAMKRWWFPTQTFAEVAGPTQLAGTKSGTAGGADVHAHEKGDGAMTAVGRGGTGVGSITVIGTRLEEVSGAGQFSAGSQHTLMGCALSQMGQQKWFSKARSKMLHSSLQACSCGVSVGPHLL